MNPELNLRQDMADAGITTRDDIIGDGRLHRFHIEGHRKGTKNGAYALFCDSHPAGWWMNYKDGVTVKWRLGGGKFNPTPEMRRQMEESKALHQAEIDARHRQGAIKAQQVIDASEPCTGHPYLTRKRVKPCHGLYVSPIGNLIIPGSDSYGALMTLQKIPEVGTKTFLEGAKAKGAMFQIGGTTETIRICEGLATGLSIHEETGDAVFVAFGAGNLIHVGKSLRECFKNRRIVICADQDTAGLAAAKEAAEAICGDLCVPPLAGDWNDYLSEAAYG